MTTRVGWSCSDVVVDILYSRPLPDDPTAVTAGQNKWEPLVASAHVPGSCDDRRPRRHHRDDRGGFVVDGGGAARIATGFSSDSAASPGSRGANLTGKGR